jgi:ABC-2 type transport system ATP-binding protein
MSPETAIEAHDLHKRYGDTQAVDGVSFAVPAGSIFGLLGPNGAGKSTTLRILTTMTAPDRGSATVGGFDVATQSPDVRRSIGVTGQDATLDELLTGRQNLVMVGELSGLSRRDAKARATELLDHFDLVDAADRMVKTYSGGMRRRLDLGASLSARSPILFLDEPTTGLDPSSRMRMWDIIRQLVAEGTTILLTTQYLEEADDLAERIAVIDHGRVVAEGAPHELKSATGEAQLEVTLTEANPDAAAVLAPLVTGAVKVSDDGRLVRAPVRNSPGLATHIVRALDGAGMTVDDIAVHQPSLDDVFMALTGHPTLDEEVAA